MDALIKALEARGFAVTASESEPRNTSVVVHGETMTLRLEEVVDRQEKVQSFFDHRHDYEYVPTGRLSLRIDAPLGGGNRRQWSDGKKSLDGQLHAVVAGLVKTAEVTRVHREQNERQRRQWAEEERRRQERERRRQEEEARVGDFDTKLARWEQAERIRRFVAAVREDTVRHVGAIVPGSEIDRWLAWAMRRADRLDPLRAAKDEDRWPPASGTKVRMTDPHGRGWSATEYGGTAIVPPDPIGEPQRGTSAPAGQSQGEPPPGAPCV